MSTGIPPIAFLGVVERAALVRDVYPNLHKYNLIGLKQTVLSHIYPLSISPLHIALAVYAPQVDVPIKFRVRDEVGNDLGTINLTLQSLETPQPTIEDVTIKRYGQAVAYPLEGWIFVTIPTSRSLGMIPKPGLYSITYDLEGQEVIIGQLLFILIDPDPLSTSRIAAIRSNPSAAKAVRAEIKCNA